MKRLFLILTVFIISITSSYAYNAYRDMLYGYDIRTAGKVININAYCYELTLDVRWSDPSEGAFGNVECGELSAEIGDYSWFYDGTSQHGSFQARRYGQYFGNVNLYLEAYDCYGYAALTWTI